jgi:hypothetical protein
VNGRVFEEKGVYPKCYTFCLVCQGCKCRLVPTTEPFQRPLPRFAVKDKMAATAFKFK